MKIIIPVDVRPTIIKIMPVAMELERRGVEYSLVHTGQHYSEEMSGRFFDEFGLVEPDLNLSVESGSHAEQTGGALIGLERYFLKRKPDMVFVHGDANMVPSACLAAAKLGIATMHNEAGLRCYCRSMPEEINRIVGDHISDYLCAPTKVSKDNLLNEGIDGRRIRVTGNTVVDAVKMVEPKLMEMEPPVAGDYMLMTLHRCEHVDCKETLVRILAGVIRTQDEFGMPVVWPMHPRSGKMIRKFGLQKLAGRLTTIEPLGYVEFLKMLVGAKVVITDSGGVQEEACTLDVPCVTVGDKTERVETLKIGSNRIAGTTSAGIVAATRKMIGAHGWRNPYGNGRAAKKVVDFITSSGESLCRKKTQ